MTLVRRIARPLLGSVFVKGGIEQLRRPTAKTPAAAKVGTQIAAQVPFLPQDPEQLVRINGAVMTVGGLLLATGRVPRIAALALVGTLVPTTLGSHRFWEEKDQEKRSEQFTAFINNLSLIGGLLLAAVDTSGRPGVAWRARRASKDAKRVAAVAAHDVAHQATHARTRAGQLVH